MSFNKNLPRFIEFGKKIVGVAKSYRGSGPSAGQALPTEPLVFLKPSTAYLTEGSPIKIPKRSSNVNHEVELGVVLSRTCKDVPESQAMQYVGGYVLALDMTDPEAIAHARKEGLSWDIAKGFDTSCPVSQFIPKDRIIDPGNIDLWLKVNGKLKQEGNTRDLIFPISYLISFISSHFTLEPGDLILTGTPEGIGPVTNGDVIQCGLGGIVTMEFNVEK